MSYVDLFFLYNDSITYMMCMVPSSSKSVYVTVIIKIKSSTAKIGYIYLLIKISKFLQFSFQNFSTHSINKFAY